MSTQLRYLLCGDSARTSTGGRLSELEEILCHIGESIDGVIKHLRWVGKQPPARLALLGPFLGRSLLEVGLTAVVARLDPMRLLAVREVQSRPDYTTEKAWKSAIHWQGDIVPKRGGDPGTKKKTDNPDPSDMSRALFGDDFDRLLWVPATERLLTLVGGSTSPWIAALATTGSENFGPRKRSEMDRIYSALSKGIHHEFVMAPGVLYDRTTVADLVQRVVQAVAEVGLVSHFVPGAAFQWNAQKALSLFSKVETLEVMT